MNATEFCYWLQGYFELTSFHTSHYEFRTKSIQCLKNHLDLVKKCDSHHNNIFIDWLEAYLKDVDLEKHLQNNVNFQSIGIGLPLFDVEKIKNYLSSQFKHEIDSNYQGDKKELQAIHDLGKTNGTVESSKSILYRC